ncbi:DUF6862 domain-containing protein, partial [Hydrogenophaga sp. 5NK40-0174]|uniref:DUF6862 domain-containing protein n=1 Tax=Hydrogenophaga sp. 5NK40-0174 TaxID=3127649 RepID=UPI00334110E9
GNPEQERLLRQLMNGELKPGDARYAEIRALAESRYRDSYEAMLNPPKPNWLKIVVAVVAAAVVTYFTAGAASMYFGGIIPNAMATGGVIAGTGGTVATVGGTMALGLGAAVGSYAGSFVSTLIQTGDVGEALQAGEKGLKAGIVSTAVKALVPGLGIADELTRFAINTSATALGSTVAYGGSFGENLLNAGMNAGFDKFGEGVAGHIGKQNFNGALTDLQAELAHGALGCGLGMVRSGNGKGCAAGAAGAVVAHSLADDVKAELKDEDSTLSSIFKAVPGKTINENTVFITGLAGSVAGGVGGALAGDTTRDLQANMNMGQITGSNAVANNYLKHDEAKKLQTLKENELFGKCDGNCKAEITRLKEVDEARNQELAACEGSSSAKCQKTFNEVRFAAAEYIRKESFADAVEFSFRVEKEETLNLAGSTVDGKLKGAAQGGWEAVKESAKGAASAGKTLFAAATGDKQAWEDIKQGAGAGWDYVAEPSNWPYLIGVMTPEDREKLAQAYESGDGNEIGSLMAQQVANLPVGGGAIGSIKKIDTAIEAAQDAARLAGGLPARKGLPDYTSNQKAFEAIQNAKLPGTALDPKTGLPVQANVTGVPRQMSESIDPNQSALDFALRFFGGSMPEDAKSVSNIPGAWRATTADGTTVIYRPAGGASKGTRDTTATVEINDSVINSVNAGRKGAQQLKLKFPKTGATGGAN